MSTERHEIIDEGSQIRILYSGSISTIISGPHGTHIEDAVIGAIRQQARDIDQLRTDLAAAVAERDRLTRSIEDDFSGWRAVERRWKLRAEQAESRLAAIEAAPTVAWQWMDTGHFRKNKPDGALVFDWRPLIARPAKDRS